MVELGLHLKKAEAQTRRTFVSSWSLHLAGSHENASDLHAHQVHVHEPQTTLYDYGRIARHAKGYNGAETSTQSVFPQSRP